MKKDDVIGGVLVLAVLAGLGAFFLFAQNGPELSYLPVELPGSALEVVPEGDGEVGVTVTLVQPGFVTIHQSIGGAPGPIIGVSGVLAPGQDVSATIGLTEALLTNLSYVGLLHVDNGDGKFVVKDDLPVTSEGKSVRADFVGF